MSTIINGDRVPIRLWAPAHEVEAQALRQLKAVASLPWVAHHVAVMPDVHVGKGATVGSVIALRGAVAPAAVGVDIGCGMAAVKTSLTAGDFPDNLKKLRLAIEAAVPVGRGLRDRRGPQGLQEHRTRDGAAERSRGDRGGAQTGGLRERLSVELTPVCRLTPRRSPRGR